MTADEALEIRRILLDMTPKERRALASATSLEEAKASAALAREKTNG